MTTPGGPPAWPAARSAGDGRHPRTVEQTNFDAIAEIYDDVFPPHIIEHTLRWRASYVLRHAAARGQSALDVGAGTVCWRSG